MMRYRMQRSELLLFIQTLLKQSLLIKDCVAIVRTCRLRG